MVWWMNRDTAICELVGAAVFALDSNNSRKLFPELTKITLH